MLTHSDQGLLLILLTFPPNVACITDRAGLDGNVLMEPLRALERARGRNQQCPPRPAPADSPKKQSIINSHSLSRALKMGLDPNLLLDLKFLSLIMFGLFVVFHSPQSTGYPFKFTIPSQVN